MEQTETPTEGQHINDPCTPSYEKSAAQSVIYRIVVTGIAICLIVLGQQNLPFEQVECIDDKLLNWLQPLAVSSQWLGELLLTLSNLLVDGTFLGMLAWWYLKADDARYIVSLGILAAIKLISTVSFQAQPIDKGFAGSGMIPSLFGGESFQYDYFFNAQIGLLVVSTLQLHQLRQPKLVKVCASATILVSTISLLLRHNFLMDIVLGVVVGHLAYRLANIHHPFIHNRIITPLLNLDKPA